MASAPAVPPASDRSIGLGFYLSPTPGVPGRLKASAEEFRVREISSYPMPDPNGAFVVLRVASRDWEQHELGAAIARRLGVPPHSVRWSGTKDRRAVSDRLLSYRGSLPERGLDLPRVELLDAYRARNGLVLGHHYGNAFAVRVVELRCPAAEACRTFRRTEASLREAGGFPNFFGPQRFGEVRPITHEVGRWVVRGDLSAAVETYLTARPSAGTPGVGDAARAAYAEHRDPGRALTEFPSDYRFERTILERLAKGQSPEKAFRALPRDLRLLFVHAYQAHLFNRWVSRRLAAGFALVRPYPGDRILRLGRDGTVRGQDSAPVGPDNERECADLVARGRAYVAGPLVGFETVVPDDPIGSLLAALLREDQVAPGDFCIPVAPELASRGTWRAVLLPVPPIGMRPDGTWVDLTFALPKGAYATVLLREFLKCGATAAPPVE